MSHNHEHSHDHNHSHSHSHCHSSACHDEDKELKHAHGAADADDDDDEEDEENPRITIVKLIFSSIILAVLLIMGDSLPPVAKYILVALGYLVVSYDVIINSVKSILCGEFLDEVFLMAVASIGAIALGEFTEAIAVIVFYKLGELFEDYAVGKSRKNIEELMDIRPDYANIEENGIIKRVSPEDVCPGTIITVNPGERIPIDGQIVSGSSTLDTAALTGESLPINVTENDEVLSGSINLTGIIKVKTTKDFSESTISRILTLVREASERKAKSENFIKKFAHIYTPVVCGSAVLLALIPPVINLILGNPAGFSTWIYRALSFLCVSCPCALVISIPLSFFAGIGCAGKNGILVKGSGYIDALSKAKTVVFDKTGTMTKGVFEVVGIHHNTIDEHELLRLSAYAESASSHPIAKSIIKAYNEKINLDEIESVEELGGNGIIATIKTTGEFKNYNKLVVAIGNDKLMKKLNITPVPCSHVGTIVHVAVNHEYAGHILIKDVLKDTAKKSIKDLNALGIHDTVMLTGDSVRVAESVAEELGISNYYGELLPADKVAKVEELLNKNTDNKSTLCFVGDGINDAPVLSRADVGIAMGGLGSDAAIEAADVVLMDDDPDKIALAIKIARKTHFIANENIVFAIGIKLICLIFTATGLTGMWLAIFADVGVMAIAVLNAMRALYIRRAK